MDAELKEFLGLALRFYTREEWDDILGTSYRQMNFQMWFDGTMMIPAVDLGSLIYTLGMDSRLTEEERALLERVRINYARYLLEPLEEATLKTLRCLSPAQEKEMLHRICADVMGILNG